MALDFAAGCLGGCAGVMVGYPLDTVKVHMQTQDYRNPRYRGTWHCFRSILAKESVIGLYRGMSSPMAGVAAVNAIVFGVYGESQRRLPEADRLSCHFLAGVLAGIAQTPVCSPIELAKTRLQLRSRGDEATSGPYRCLRRIYQLDGCRGLFNGLGVTFLREAPSYGIYFLTYEAITRSSAEQVSTPMMLLAGGLAGTMSWVLTYPIDVIKSRVQAERCGRYTGALDCLRKSVRAEGYACLYRGLNSTIIRAFPTNAATFAVVTWTFRIFGPEGNAGAAAARSSSKDFVTRRDGSSSGWSDFLDEVSILKYFSPLQGSSFAISLAGGTMMERKLDRFIDQKVDRKLDRKWDQTMDQKRDQTIDRKMDQELNRKLDRNMEQETNEKLERKMVQNLGEKLDENFHSGRSSQRGNDSVEVNFDQWINAEDAVAGGYRVVPGDT